MTGTVVQLAPAGADKIVLQMTDENSKLLAAAAPNAYFVDRGVQIWVSGINPVPSSPDLYLIDLTTKLPGFINTSGQADLTFINAAQNKK